MENDLIALGDLRSEWDQINIIHRRSLRFKKFLQLSHLLKDYWY